MDISFPDKSIYCCLIYFCPRPVDCTLVTFGMMLLVTLT